MTGTRIGEAYDRRADEYIRLFGSVEDTAERDARVIAQWRDGVRGPVLDAGCGPGHWTDFLAARGEGGATGIDASDRFVSAARARFPHLRFEKADLADLPFEDGSFGGVLAWFSLIHTPPAELPGIVRELARVLEPGGSLLVGYFDGPAGAAFDHAVATAYYWSATALRDVLEAERFAVQATATRKETGMRAQGELVATRGGTVG